ncbi:NAD(P)/FAD-dependent oxidoreductase [Novosphingobium taihuense]|uniref:NADH:ubiquinone reductase (non-electrogenic) n=1 Tax=Novosphingobium taihuense TaxID=260085 RepID=A0A7W7A9R3_9SPHN|nr:NAD(P)/FAD-dependent oxidoreductase [Novosphingobium taihuense]MBB4613014.1 NADH dehydrogenase [Novosphingobium taihuense]TWH85158.1 putative oxidoreductase [Novosphingobium taihuense]
MANRPHVVIVGAGFGGLAAARALADAPIDVTVIDRRNHHLFQPLLYQVATAGLSPADIAGSIRSILRDQKNTRVLLDEVCRIDRLQRIVHTRNGRPLQYDWLIIATGAQHSYFGKDEWAPHAPGIKTIDDATAVRRRVLIALERAETELDKSTRDALLTFVVIGGGPTGVEMAGAIAELARQSVSKDFRHITPHCSKVWLLQKGNRLLPSFPEKLSADARRALEHLGVSVRLGGNVEQVTSSGVSVSGEFIPTHTVVWAAGVMASPAAHWLTCKPDRSGRVEVDSMLKAKGSHDIFVIGDTARCIDATGREIPGVAPAAKQQGRYAAQAILAQLHGQTVEPFRYRDYGQMATIGRARAVCSIGGVKLSGHTAWLVWCLAHVWYLNGLRNRISVTISWIWNYLTFERGARLITGELESGGR